jgi:hypothetical protein
VSDTAPDASGQVSPDQFADSIKAKYPEYAKVDNATLTAKMLEKYPEYKAKVNMALAKTMTPAEYDAAGQPNSPREPGLEEVPITALLGLAADALADKANAARNSLPAATTAAGSIARRAGQGVLGLGELGLRTAGAMVPKTKGDVAGLIASGPVGNVAAEAAPGFMKYGGKAAAVTGDWMADLAGAWTGKDPEYIKAVFQKPEIMKKVGEAIGLDIQKSATEAIAIGRKALGDQVGAAEDGIAMFGKTATAGNSPMVDLKTPLKDVVKTMESRGHYVPKELGGRAVPMKKYALDPMSEDYRTVAGYLKDLNKDMDFGEALNLKRELDGVINYGKKGTNGLQPVTGPANAILKDIRAQVKNAMTKSLTDPQTKAHWLEVNKAAEEGYRAFDSLHSQVIGSQPYQTAQRIARNIKNQSVEEQVLGPAAKLSKKAEDAVMDIRDRVVAAQFKRRFTGVNASNLIPSSPRAIGNIAALLGRGVEPANGAMTALAHFAISHPNVTGNTLSQMLVKEMDRKRQAGQ